MSEHPAHYANVILEKERKKLYGELKVANGGEYPQSINDEWKDCDHVRELLKKIRQIEMAEFCIHMEL